MFLTFVDVNDVWVLDGGHDLYFSSDPDQVCLRLYLALFNGFDGDLIKEIQINRVYFRRGFPHYLLPRISFTASDIIKEILMKTKLKRWKINRKASLILELYPSLP